MKTDEFKDTCLLGRVLDVALLIDETTTYMLGLSL